MIINDHNPNDLDRIRTLVQALQFRDETIAELRAVIAAIQPCAPAGCEHDWKLGAGEGTTRRMYCVRCDLGLRS